MNTDVAAARRRAIVLLALLAVYLLVAEKPWSGEIRKRLAAGKELKLEHFITIGTWWGAAAGAVLLSRRVKVTMMLAGCRWRPLQPARRS